MIRPGLLENQPIWLQNTSGACWQSFRIVLTIVRNLRGLVDYFSRLEFFFDSFLVKKNGRSKGFLMREKYAEVPIFIFLSFRSSDPVKKSMIFENCRLLKIDTRSKTLKHENCDFCVFFPYKESLRATDFFYQKRIEAKLEAWKFLD